MVRGDRRTRAQLLSVEWNKLTCTDASIERMLNAGVLPEAAIGGWRLSRGESYPDPAPVRL